MGKNKLKRFAVNAQRRNVVEPGKEIFEKIKGNWNNFFDNENEIILELGCGRGEYTTGLASLFPQKNYIGVDIKGARIWKGSCVAEENNLTNAAFLRIRMYELENFFSEGEADEIWITFPDPRPVDKHEKHRLTYPRYIDSYLKILKPGGILHLKTDNLQLHEYTLAVMENYKDRIKSIIHTEDLYNSPMLSDHYGIQTTYERRFLMENALINYLKVEFN
ncbi:MAG: tRNA (guanosine(46)-N7)-methyltransferase TrmB [Sporocytophaga sp.]|uniref:tRNA (guanosine(46)-N7)-methyltransferase TrmB n=1 Tax=Sporocytophaga sp. TaxID=2231183 RepID=UPI001AFFCEC6|nr:tRNA (guanosine(46)-N7)-methyltransferase TrmB [Sporocytophaga sp.]MBO9700661.1 tRNA (guanosine(46)-N7)-methyltransferase TrmB [Sporocytophaga sp.]